MSDARAILDALPKPVALVDGRLGVIDANRAFLARFGGAPASGPAGLWQALEAAVARMQPASRRGRFRWVGGSPEALPWDVHVTRLPDGRYLVHADEVSDYVAAEAIQSGVRAYVERVLNHIDRAVSGLDEDLRVTFFNAAQADLWLRGGQGAAVDTVGEPIARVYPVFDAERWRAIGDALARGEPVRHERVTWDAAGGLRLDVSVLPLDGPGQRVTGAVCVTEVIEGR